jgi:uncharacterized protein YndB with AHSA1/START domain
MSEQQRYAGMGDDAVREATGKSWEEWFRKLDRAGAKEMEHAAIARHLSEEENVPDWWCQMVTVGYEQARGLRQKHQRPDGFSVSASRTLAVPIERAFDAFADAKTRKRWLSDTGFTVRRATRPKSLRITWVDGVTNVDVNLYAKDDGRSQVSVQHSKLPDADAAARMKAYWGEALDRLREKLAG